MYVVKKSVLVREDKEGWKGKVAIKDEWGVERRI